MLTQSDSKRIPIRYIRWKGNNFGDNINDVLFQDVFGIKTSVESDGSITDGINLLGIGTIFNNFLKVSHPATVWVIGSGAGYTMAKPNLPSNSLVCFVRGPLTCQYYNLPSNLALADSAYLLSEHFHEVTLTDPHPLHRFGIIPNHASIEINPRLWEQVSQRAFIIDPHLDWKTFIRQVNACEIIMTECLHGAIAADILRKPFIVFATTPVFHAFKWLDWASSMGLSLNIHIFNFEDPEEIYHKATPTLSTPETLNRVREQLELMKNKIRRQLEMVTN
jgi:succinoglycan biosynthesis protein ExoV